MATDAGRKASKGGPFVGSINSPDGIVEVVRGFREALKAFNSEQGFQNLAELVDRVPKLEEDVLAKERALKLAQETSEREREEHQSKLQSNLQLYTAEYKRLEMEKSQVEKRVMELQKSITEKDQIITEKEAKVLSLKEAGRKIEEQCKSMHAKLKAKDGEIAQLKHQNQDGNAKVESLTADLKRSQGEVASTNGSLQKMQQRNAQLGAALAEAQAQQQEMISYSATLQDVETSLLAQELSAVWVSVTELVRRFVGDDLSENMLKRDWTALNDAAGHIPIKQLPQSNTEIAKELRVIKVLAIIASAIHKHLLQPTYQPANENGALNGALYDLASVEPKRERMLRGMLLAALEHQRGQAEEQLLDWIMEDIILRQGVGMVVRPDLTDEFERSLDDILSDVQDIWQKVQYGTQVFESQFEVTKVTDFGWRVPGSQLSQCPIKPGENDDDLVILFPTIFLLSHEKIPVTTGTIVRKSQISALIKEERHNSRSTEAGPSRPRPRQRTMSTSNSARNGAVKEAFLSRPAGTADGPLKA